MVFGKSLLQNKGVFFVVFAIVLLIFATIYPNSVKPIASKKIEPLLKLNIQKLFDGDLIFRKGRDLISSLVLTQGDSAQFSHVGVIVKRGGQVSVIHSLPEDANSASGVQIESLSAFTSFNNASDIAIYRLKGIDGKMRNKITEYILQQVGKPFDADFLLSTDDRMYCTELVVKAFAIAGVELAANVESIKIMLIDELVIPPDHLRRSTRLVRLSVRQDNPINF